MKISILDLASFDTGDLDLSALHGCSENMMAFPSTKQDQVSERIADANIVISNKVRIDAEAMNAASKLRLIVVAATGVNNVDLPAASERGITVCNVKDYATPTVVQHTIMLILALSSRLLDYHRVVREGAWQKSPFFCLLDFPIRELDGKTLGIVGYGNLGRGVAQVAEALGMKIKIANRPHTPTQTGRIPLAELLPQVDVLSLHCPLTEDTGNLIAAKELQSMRNDALLINTARGGIVNETDLAAALKNGEIGGAGFDVLTEEPPINGHLLLDPTIPNLIVTPHNAWASRETRQRLVGEVVKNIQAFLSGSPRNVVV